ncbi:MAG: S8 family serine peptidase [Rhodospirillales bacterium]
MDRTLLKRDWLTESVILALPSMSTIISKDTQKKADRSYTSRRAANWNKASLKCGQGIRLGMIDGSVDTKHPTFKGSNLKYRSFHLKGQTAGAIRHGTAVANVMIGNWRWGGLLPKANLFAANVFHKRKKGKSRASTKSVLLAINWLTKLRVDVINFSIGGSYNSLIAHAIEKAHKSGIILIASAGNSEPFTKKKSYPAAYKQAVAIAASDRFNRTAKFSSAGSYVEFTAPGVRIWTAVPGGGRAMSGTSFSAPIVSSLVAAALKTEGIQDLESVRGYLRSHAKDRGKEGWDKYTGWGIVGIKPLC